MPASDVVASRPQWGLRVSVLAVIVGAILLLRWTVFAPEPVIVRTEAVEHGLVAATVTNSKAGTVRARRRAFVTAEMGGRVVEIAHLEGTWVEKDTLLLRLADAAPRAQIELAEQGVRVSTARRDEVCLRRDRAGRELERKRGLASEQIVSEDLLDELQYAFEAARVSCEAASAELLRSRASLHAAQVDLEKTMILAPFAGVIAELSTEIGEWVTPSPPLLTSPPVVDLIDPTSLYISAPMDEVDSGNIRPEQSVLITVDSRPGESFAGSVHRVAPYVLDTEAQNRTVEIEVEFENPADMAGLLPGTSADVEVVLKQHDGVRRIPTSALFEGNRVLVLEDDVLSERRVRLGLKNWDYAELIDGLEAGDRVVVSLDRLEVKAGAKAVMEAANAEEQTAEVGAVAAEPAR